MEKYYIIAPTNNFSQKQLVSKKYIIIEKRLVACQLK